jgi:ferredoxin
MKIAIDPSACDGFGYCAEIVPEAIALDEWGFPFLVAGEVSDRLLGAARQAARSCPRRALTLVPLGVHLTARRSRVQAQSDSKYA